MASYQQVQTIAAIDDNFLLCGICCELYKVPKILPCLHIFCEGCLTQLADKNGGHTFSCPLCRRSYALPQDDVSNFRTDIFLSGLVNDKQGDAVSKTKKCDACKTGDVVKVCTDCPMAICEICVRVHRNIPLTHAHNLMTPEDYESSKVNDPASVQQPVYCDSHPNIELKMYCVTCQKAICSECGMVAHYEHKHRYLKDSADDYVKELSGMVEKLKTKCQETKISMTKIQETSEKLESNYKNENQKVKEHVEEITQQVKVAGQRLQEEVKHIYNRQKTNLNAQFKELEGLDSDIHAVEEYATNFMQRGSPAQLMSSKTAMTTQIQHLLKTNTNPTPIESGYLQFKPSSNIIDAQTMGKVTDKRSVYVLEGIPQPARTNEIVQATLRPKFPLESRIVASHVKAKLTTPTGVEDVKMIEANGTFFVKLSCTLIGTYKLSVTIDNVQVEASPVIFQVTARKGLLYKFGVGGTGDGQLIKPYGVTLTSQCHVLVCDYGNNRLQIFNLQGQYLRRIHFTDLGKPFSPKYAVVVGGNIFVTDDMNKQIIVCDEDGKLVRVIGKGELNSPVGIAFNQLNGQLYVVDSGSFCIRVYTLDGVLMKSFGEKGNKNGQFSKTPNCITISKGGLVYVASERQAFSCVFNSDGEFLYQFGKFTDPEDMTTGKDGCVYVNDYQNNSVTKYDLKGVFLSCLVSRRDGLHSPTGICVFDFEPLPLIIIVDHGNSCIRVYSQ